MTNTHSGRAFLYCAARAFGLICEMCMTFFLDYDLIGAEIVFLLRLHHRKIAGRLTKIVCCLFLAEFKRSV
jgi:hypothetical protein